jgi:hypothetical protein
MLSLSSFSQTDTTSTTLPNKILREVAKDLIRYDGCKAELLLTNEKLQKVEEREKQKDVIIDLFRSKDENNQYIIRQQELQIFQYEKLADDLTKEIKRERTSKTLWKIGAFVGAGTTAYLLLK